MLTRALTTTMVLWAVAGAAQVSAIGDIIVVTDATGSIHQRVAGLALPGLVTAQGLACQDASRAALGVLADEYDFIVVFLSENVTGPGNIPSFAQARVTVQNIGQNPLFNDGTPFGSRAKLKGCVFMGSAVRLPLDPESVADLGSGNVGLRAIEVLGHEVGHYWLVGADYNLGTGKQEDLRSGDRHYSQRVDSRSVMFGSCIDALGGGLFRIISCPRKYNALDQYFMGLIPPTQVQPIMLAWGSGAFDPPYPLAPGAAPVTIMGTERQVGLDAITREMGVRSPAHPNTQRCFRTGFVYVSRSSPSPDAIMKVDIYRRTFEAWFQSATDSNGFIDTRATGTGCVRPAPDAGLPSVDAGVDAGVEDAGIEDAGVEPMDAGSPPRQGAPPERVDTMPLKPLGCGCASAEGVASLLALAWVLARRSAAPLRAGP